MQQLKDEIAEITELIGKWETVTDPETLWAISLLKACRERRERILMQLLGE